RRRARLAVSADQAVPRASGESDENLLAFLEEILKTYARYCRVRLGHPEWRAEIAHWVSFHLPEPFDFSKLVDTRRPNAALPEERVGPPERHRRREGFTLTDPRMNRREVLGQTHYCLLCHEREKDSCSKGFFDTKTKTFQ